MSWIDDIVHRIASTFAPGAEYSCPIDGCEVRVTVPEVTFSWVGSVFTSNRVAASGVPVEELEQAFAEHFKSHSLVDVLQTIRNRDYEIRGLRAALRIEDAA